LCISLSVIIAVDGAYYRPNIPSGHSQPPEANGQTFGLGTVLLALEHLWNKTSHSTGCFQ